MHTGWKGKDHNRCTNMKVEHIGGAFATTMNGARPSIRFLALREDFGCIIGAEAKKTYEGLNARFWGTVQMECTSRDCVRKTSRRVPFKSPSVPPTFTCIGVGTCMQARFVKQPLSS